MSGQDGERLPSQFAPFNELWREFGSQDSSDDRVRAAFLANLRHELRTPINAIISYSEMILEDLEGETDKSFAEDLQKIRSAGERLLRIVGDILSPSAAERSEGVDLEALGENMRYELRTPLDHVINYSEMLLEEADALNLPQAKSDLKKIHISAEKLLALVDQIVNLAKFGIDQADQTSTDAVKLKIKSQRSSGMDAAGGDAPLLPGLDDTSISNMISGVISSIQPLEAQDLERKKVRDGKLLLVDDNETNRDILSRRLQKEGYTVVTAVNGVHALEMIVNEPFDLVLLDVMMPELNGFQVLERLKKDPKYRHIPVIMISALDEIDSVVRCIEIGAEDYLPKSCNPILLRARIEASLEKKRFQDREAEYLKQIEEERKKSDRLLHVILPPSAVKELKENDAVTPRRYDNVAVLFCDIVGFTAYCEQRPPEEVVSNLQRLVETYEDYVEEHEMDKIKTIGDSFMATAGLLAPVENPVLNCVRCGLKMIDAARDMPVHWNVRVGVHFGAVVAGVLGRRQFLFDLWGDTVNVAARMESHGVSGAIMLSAHAWDQISDVSYGDSRGFVDVKGKGRLETFLFSGFIS